MMSINIEKCPPVQFLADCQENVRNVGKQSGTSCQEVLSNAENVVRDGLSRQVVKPVIGQAGFLTVIWICNAACQ
jgi:hypothetical protein